MSIGLVTGYVDVFINTDKTVCNLPYLMQVNRPKGMRGQFKGMV
jgi:hypothetical protein